MGETRILEKWKGKTFSCKEFLLWIQSDEVPQPVHVMYGAFQRLKRRGYIIHVSGKSGGTVYRMVEPKKEKPASNKIYDFALDSYQDMYSMLTDEHSDWLDVKTALYIMPHKVGDVPITYVSLKPFTWDDVEATFNTDEEEEA